VPQALQGTLPAAPETNRKGEVRKHEKEKKRAPATVDEGLKNIFQGIGLFIIFLVGLYAFRGAFWVTVWFIIPALASVGEGIGHLIRVRQEQRHLTASPHHDAGNFSPATFAPAPTVREFSSPDTTEIVGTPASVTDVTTRHLDARSKTT
jgi:hypothetical protein